MPESSVFTDKEAPPAEESLSKALGKQFASWNNIKNYVFEKSTTVTEEWSFSKSGWNYRIRGKKSVIIYLMPCCGYFIASFVLGKKACEMMLSSSLAPDIKKTISEAKTYAEGTGFRIDVKTAAMTAEIKKLVDAKLS